MPRADRKPKASQADIARAIRAAQAAGLAVERVEIDADKIVIVTQEGEKAVNQPLTLVEHRRARRGAD